MTAPDAKPVALRIRLPFATEDEFVERYGHNVARGEYVQRPMFWLTPVALSPNLQPKPGLAAIQFFPDIHRGCHFRSMETVVCTSHASEQT